MYGKCSECQLDWHTTDIPQPDDNFDHNEKDEQSKKAMKTNKKRKNRGETLTKLSQIIEDNKHKTFNRIKKINYNIKNSG